jgi:hypothetical protein
MPRSWRNRAGTSARKIRFTAEGRSSLDLIWLVGDVLRLLLVSIHQGFGDVIFLVLA